MRMNNYLTILLFIIFSSIGFAQIDSIELEINNQIWKPFSTAFKTLNIEMFQNIHHKDFIRISGNSKEIKSRADYLNQYKKNWQNSDRNLIIDFRFIERIHSVDIASERGIYKLSITNSEGNTNHYYGKFHVILKLENNEWKLFVDYDSNEDNTINEEAYNALSAKD